MRHCQFVTRLALALCGLCLAVPVAAQETQPRFELTPIIGYRFGGDFEDDETGEKFDLNDSSAFGIIFNIDAKPEGQWELLYARQSTEVDTEGAVVSPTSIDLDVEYFQLGGSYLFDGERVRPFIALTLGATRFDPQFADLDSESYFSASFAAGIKLEATKRLGLRFEGRVYTTFVESDSEIFCSSTFGVGECLIQSSGTALNQWEARGGLIFRF